MDTNSSERRAYGRCEKCFRFMYGHEDTGGFHPDEHLCSPPERGAPETGVEELEKGPEIRDRHRRRRG